MTDVIGRGTGHVPGARRTGLRMSSLMIATVGLLSASAGPSAAAGSSSADAAAVDTVQAIVVFDAKPGRDAKKAVEDAGGTINKTLAIVNGLAIDLPRGKLNALTHAAHVKSVELDGQITTLEPAPVTATSTGDLEYDNAWGVTHIGSKAVHDAGIWGRGIKVAVIDTGIDYIHDDPVDVPYVVDPEFNSNYRGGYDFFNHDSDPYDDNGHGTHVAGILAAEKNGYLVVGVAPQVDLYALKILGASGEGEVSDLILALQWAVDNNIDVVNMSLGTHEVSPALATAVSNASAAGLMMVAASGNTVTFPELLYGCPVTYPGAYPEVLSTTFTNPNDALTGYSCTGPEVDFGAPGDAIFSPVPMGTCMLCTPYGYASESGTSMASPHLAGTVALLLSAGLTDQGAPGMFDDVKNRLCATTDPGWGVQTGFGGGTPIPPSDPRYAMFFGCGVIRADHAVLGLTPPNAPPVATADAVTVNEDNTTDVPVLANDTDPDGDALIVSSAGDSPHGQTSVNANNTIHYIPDLNFAGDDSFSYSISDGHGGTATSLVTVHVLPVEDPPVAADDTATTAEDTAVDIPVLANDTDVDGDALSVVGVGSAVKGAPTINPDGTVHVVPTPGAIGAASFEYTVSDGHGGTDVGAVSITITHVNHPPIAVDDTATTNEDTGVSIPVMANDSDPDGDLLSVSNVGTPTTGTAALNPTGTAIVFAPALNFNGASSFDYTLSDGHGGFDTATVVVTVAPVQDPPLAVDDRATTAEDTALNIAVLANDTDVDGDALSVIAVSGAVNGTPTINPDGTVRFVPTSNATGAASMNYTISDGHGGTDVGGVSVTITPVNDAPVAVNDSATTGQGVAVTVSVLANDTDVEGSVLSVASVSDPPHGTAVANANGTITYTPDPGYHGPDAFGYTASDGSSSSNVATVSITVTPANPFHVGDLDGVGIISGKTWTAKVTIRIETASNAALSGAVVTGTWSNGGSASCTTASNGTCSAQKTKMSRTAEATVTFTVTNVTRAGGTYVPAANHDPDGDSNGTSIIVGHA